MHKCSLRAICQPFFIQLLLQMEMILACALRPGYIDND